MLATGRGDGIAEDLRDDRAKAACRFVIAFGLHFAERNEDMGRLDLRDR